MTLDVEVVVDGGMGGEEAPSRSSGLEALHFSLRIRVPPPISVLQIEHSANRRQRCLEKKVHLPTESRSTALIPLPVGVFPPNPAQAPNPMNHAL